jgi:hypothetical protein
MNPSAPLAGSCGTGFWRVMGLSLLRGGTLFPMNQTPAHVCPPDTKVSALYISKRTIRYPFFKTLHPSLGDV